MKIVDTDTSTSSLPAPPSKDTAASEQALLNSLRKDIESRLGGVKDQVLVDSFDGGVRIQLVDKAARRCSPWAAPSSAPTARRCCKCWPRTCAPPATAWPWKGTPTPCPNTSSKYTNWELSTDRASAARRELEVNGINPGCLMRVAGYAATQPLVKDDPLDPRNRRISIMIYSNTACKPATPSGPDSTMKPGEGTLPPITRPRVPIAR